MNSMQSIICFSSFSPIHFVLYALVIFLTYTPISTSYGSGNETDHYALLNIKSMITQDPYGALTSWNNSFHFCDWTGVTCGKRHRRVTYLVLQSQGLVGSLSPHVGNLTFLHSLSLANNSFRGVIPQALGRLSRLRSISLGHNKFNGAIPCSLYNLSLLTSFSMSKNKLTGSLPPGIGAMLPNLAHFQLSDNQLTGPLTQSISSWSRLIYLDMEGNQFHGNLPRSISNLVGLELLALGGNQFTGNIPSTIGNLQKLQILSLYGNKLSGTIPNAIGNLSLLIQLDLSSNRLEGHIPSSLGNCNRLLELHLNANKLNGKIPTQLFQLSSLSIVLDLSQNNMFGSLPTEVENLNKLSNLDLSENHLSGYIPSSLGSCASLSRLSLKGNLFQGMIPPSLSSLKGLVELDISLNDLSGKIPLFLERFSLKYVNLSFNDFEGEVQLANASVFSVLGNSRLCSGFIELGLPKCKETKKYTKKSHSYTSVILIASTLFTVICLAIVCCKKKNKIQALICLAIVCCKKNNKIQVSQSSMRKQFLKVSYNQLLKATNGFSESSLIGSGAFGYVYKGILDDDEEDRFVAVKVLHPQNQGAQRSFMRECEAWQNIRHRNLLKIITSCSTIDFQGNDFKALVYEFMPNGSLYDWLHPSESALRLNLLQSINILIDVASALEYMHNHCVPAVVHGDLKPSNILLNDDMVAHVGDFGLARFLGTTSYQNNSTGIRGTIGYAAPEYGLGNEMTCSGDIYSFGILLLEVITGKKPTHDIFNAGLSLHKFASMALRDHVLDVVDISILNLYQKDEIFIQNKEENTMKIEECLMSTINIGVSCSMNSPQERMDIKNVIHELQHIRDTLQNICYFKIICTVFTE